MLKHMALPRRGLKSEGTDQVASDLLARGQALMSRSSQMATDVLGYLASLGALDASDYDAVQRWVSAYDSITDRWLDVADGLAQLRDEAASHGMPDLVSFIDTEQQLRIDTLQRVNDLAESRGIPIE